MARAALIAALALVLCACPRPRRVSGVVYGPGRALETGRALAEPVSGATVTWVCPPGAQGPEPQTLRTDANGAFKSKDFFADMPGECELLVSMAGHAPFREKVARLCGDVDRWRCSSPHVAIELKSITAEQPGAALPPAPLGVASAVPLDAPGDARTVIEVDLRADGRLSFDGKAMSDAELLEAARAAQEKNPDVRAVIRADQSVTHGRVVAVIDVLKQAKISKIAFGVVPKDK